MTAPEPIGDSQYGVTADGDRVIAGRKYERLARGGMVGRRGGREIEVADVGLHFDVVGVEPVAGEVVAGGAGSRVPRCIERSALFRFVNTCRLVRTSPRVVAQHSKDCPSTLSLLV